MNNINLKVSVFCHLVGPTILCGSRFQIGMIRGMKLFLCGSFVAYERNSFHDLFCCTALDGLLNVAGGLCNSTIYKSVGQCHIMFGSK